MYFYFLLIIATMKPIFAVFVVFFCARKCIEKIFKKVNTLTEGSNPCIHEEYVLFPTSLLLSDIMTAIIKAE